MSAVSHSSCRIANVPFGERDLDVAETFGRLADLVERRLARRRPRFTDVPATPAAGTADNERAARPAARDVRRVFMESSSSRLIDLPWSPDGLSERASEDDQPAMVEGRLREDPPVAASMLKRWTEGSDSGSSCRIIYVSGSSRPRAGCPRDRHCRAADGVNCAAGTRLGDAGSSRSAWR